MRIPGALLRRRRWLSGGAVSAAALTVAGFAFVNPGYPTADVELHDGGVWVTNGSELLLGRLNKQIDELDSALTSASADLDVVQEAGTVLAVAPGAGVLQPVDVAFVALDGDVRIPPGAQVGLGGGRVTVTDPTTGSVWVRDAAQLGALDVSSQAPDLELGTGGQVAVGPSGTVAGLSVADDALTVLQPGAAATTTPLGRDLQDATVTVVGTRAVVLDPAAGQLLTADGDPVALGDAAGAVLQQPGPAAPGVLVATDAALLEAPLDGGDVRQLAVGAGGPIAPVRVAACAHAAWTTTPTYAQDCADGDPFRVEIPGSTPGAVLRFRVNRDAVVLNDLTSGTVWLLDEAMTTADNWDDVRPPDPQDDTDQESDDVDDAETLQRSEQNQPPTATDDSFGARPGLPTLLPVLDNDTDPDGDVLVISALDAPGEDQGTVAAVQDSSRVQFTAAAGATGTVTFGYTVDDGRGGTDSATVVVEIRPFSVNEPPVQQRESQTVVVQGGSVEHDVLRDWLDPDGDELTLVSATATTADTVRSTSAGRVTFIDSGTAPGRKDVTVEVGDGTASGTGVLSVDVRPAGQLPPTARADYATAFVGEQVVVSPLLNDTDPNQDQLRLSAVEAPAGLTVVPDYVAGTFTASAAVAGTYYVVYTVVDGPNSAQGLVRVDVRSGGTNNPPVAVRDLAFVPAAGSVTVDVLANDVDPDGDVLVVTGVSVATGSGLSVSVVDHRFLTIAAASVLPAPVTVTYTVSDGTATASGGVIVRPVVLSAVNQPPVAVPDTATVRAGDVLTLDVLGNDSDPDGDPLTLVPTLPEPASAGTVSVVGDRLHVVAPAEAGTVRVVYAVSDSVGQTASALVTLYVRAADDQNSPPVPTSLTARALAGSTTRVTVPLDGIDPDGDSVRVVGIGSAPTKGRVVEVGTDHLVYEAYDETGTDTFTYLVEDRYGARGTATVRVGIADRPAGNQAPTAQDDAVTTRGGRTVTVDVLANDADPDGDVVRFADDPFPEGTGEGRPTLSGGRVRVQAPDEGQVTVPYAITDGRGGADIGYLTVTADDTAPLRPPVAVDDVVTTDELVPGEFVPVAVLDNDSDPDGSAEDLAVEVAAGQDVARVDDEGRVLVRGTDAAQTIGYTITDVDGQSASAVVQVPSALNLPPRFRDGAGQATVGAGGQTFALDDLVVDPEGAGVRLTGADITATRSDGGSLADDETTLRFTPAPNYAGPASLSFEVTDGAADDPAARTVLLTLAITVESDVNQPPVFAGASVSAVVGEGPSSLDLAPLVEDPDGDAPTFALPATLPPGFDVSLSGTTLTVGAADGAVTGAIARLELTVTDGVAEPQPAPVDLVVASSSRPLTRAVADAVTVDQGDTATVPVLANDANPFPDTPLEITAAQVLSGDASASVDGDQVAVTPGGSFVGTVTVQYTVRDKTGDATRDVTGVLTATVRGVPSTPVAPTVQEVRDSTVVLTWPSPAANGAPIVDYEVTADGVSQTCTGTTCTLTGLTNGTTYRFSVTARNEVGDSPASPASGPARPDAQPDPPASPTAVFGDRSLQVTWTPPTNRGTPITKYELELSPAVGGSVTATGTSYTFTGLTNGQSYQVRVRAFNDAPDPSEWSAYSAPETPAGVPAQPTAPTAAVAGGQLGGQVDVQWTAPDGNGATIDTFALQVLRNGAVVNTLTYPGGTTSANIAADNANDYTFTVSATNKAGTSTVSAASSSVRVYGKPGTVGAVQASENDGSSTLTFTDPSDNGQAIQRFEYMTNGGGVSTLAGNRTVTGLANGSQYSFQVRACNSYCGDWSPASNTATPYGPPPQPGVNASGSFKTVTFSWSPPGTNGRPIDHLEISIDGSGWENVGPGSGSRQVGNGYNQGHSIQVRAVDTTGQAGPSSTASAVSRTPTVTVGKGSSANGRPGCNSTACAYITVSVSGIQPGCYDYLPNSREGSGGYVVDNLCVDGNGNGSMQSRDYYGYSDGWVTVQIDGVTGRRDPWG